MLQEFVGITFCSTLFSSTVYVCTLTSWVSRSRLAINTDYRIGMILFLLISVFCIKINLWLPCFWGFIFNTLLSRNALSLTVLVCTDLSSIATYLQMMYRIFTCGTQVLWHFCCWWGYPKTNFPSVPLSSQTVLIHTSLHKGLQRGCVYIV